MSDLSFSKSCLYFLTIIGLISLILGGLKAAAYYNTPDLMQEKAEVPLNRERFLLEDNLFSANQVQDLKKQLAKNQDNLDSSSVVENQEILSLPENSQPPELPISASLDPELMRFNRVMQYAIERKLSDRPLGEIMQAIAEQFLGTPYAAGLLDRSNQESLVVTLTAFDCVLFVETVLAIARGVAQQDYNYENFRDRIEEQRYRGGKLNGYCSRLHYFSDWIEDNQNRRLVDNITRNLGGISLHNTLKFMTENRQYYPQLANQSDYQCMLNQEARLANLNIYYIPQDEIATIYDNLKPGDIIATATDIPGLDVTHTGLVYRFSDGGIGFIHASPSGEVKISRDLQSYVQAVDGQIGIIIARPR
jgi:hypothetical protein